MRIECEMNEQEFDWWLGMRKKLKDADIGIARVFRDEEENGICIQLTPVILSEEEAK